MDAIALSLLSHPKLSKPTSFLVAENEPRLQLLALLKILPVQATNLSIRAYADSRFRAYPKRNLLSKSFEEDGNIIHKSSDTRLSSRERLVALFKRIQTSISEEDSRNKRRKISQASTDDSSVERAVVDFLQQSIRETKAKRSKKVKHNEEATRKRRPKKERVIPLSQPSSDFKTTRHPSNFVKKSPIPLPTPLRRKDLRVIEANVIDSETERELPQIPPSDFKQTRLPSNFLKKSPILLPTPPRGKDIRVTEAKIMDSESERDLPQIRAMKLVELKELAKERGIRGYSKLNKTELLELLRSQVRA